MVNVFDVDRVLVLTLLQSISVTVSVVVNINHGPTLSMNIHTKLYSHHP